MCYSPEVSIGTFAFTALITVWLWIRNKGLDRPIGLILLFIAGMQLIEFLLWKNLECNDTNKLVSKAIPVYLMLQPAVINLIVWFYGAGKGAGYLELGIAALILAGVTAWSTKYLRQPCAILGPTKNLVWSSVPSDDWINRIGRLFYYPAIFYPILTLKNTTFSLLYGAFAAGSLAILGAESHKSWPSLWCQFINLLGIFAVVRQGP